MNISLNLPTLAPSAGGLPGLAGESAPTSGVDAEFAALVELNLAGQQQGGEPEADADEPAARHPEVVPATVGYAAPAAAALPVAPLPVAPAVPTESATPVVPAESAAVVAPTGQTAPAAHGAQETVPVPSPGAAAALMPAPGTDLAGRHGVPRNLATAPPAAPASATPTAPASLTVPTTPAAPATTGEAQEVAPVAALAVEAGAPTRAQREGRPILPTVPPVGLLTEPATTPATPVAATPAAMTTPASPGPTAGPLDLAGFAQVATRSADQGPDLSFTSVATDPVTQPVSGLGAGAAAAVALGATSPVDAPAATQHAAVTGQVFPEVTRLVSRGDGTQRITLQLSPEALGDVKVVLTVKDGAVHVSLSASSLAQQSLLHGAPELHRLLELVGASSTQIVVKDLPTGAGTPSAGDTGQQPGQHAGQPQSEGTGRDRTHDQHAWMRGGDTSARDGKTLGAPAPPPTDPGTRTRFTGVDVTM